MIYGLFFALSVAMTWPIVAQLGQAVPGQDGDVYVRLWTHRWVRDSLQTGRSPFFTDMLFFPSGVSLASHNIAWFNIAAWLPLQIFLSEAAAYSIVYLGILALNGFAGYLLVYEHTRSRLPALTGGFIIAFWPLILSHQHHPNIILVAWVILAMLYLKRTIERSKLRDALLLALFLALIGISRWQMLLIGGVLIAGYGLFLILRPGCFTRRNLLLIGLAVILSGIVMLPLLWPGLKELLSTSASSSVFDVGEGNSIDLQALLMPSRYHPLWGSRFTDIYLDRYGIAGFFAPFVGYTTLLLVVLGLILKWRDVRMWFFLGLILLGLSLGDELRIGGVPYLPLPYHLIDEFPIVRLVRHPLRFGVVLAIPVAMMAGYGMAAIQSQRRFSLRQSRVVALIIIGLLLFEYATSFPMMPLHVPAWFEELAKDQEEFGIVNIPLGGRASNEDFMLYQIVHSKPIAGGKIARVPDTARSFINEVPMLARSMQGGIPSSEELTVAAQFSKLSENNIRYLVLHKEQLGDYVTGAWKARLNLPPVYEDNELVVYHTTLPERTATYDSPTGAEEVGIVDHGTGTLSEPQVAVDATLDDGVHLDGYDLHRLDVGPGGDISITLYWRAESTPSTDYTVFVHLVDWSIPAIVAQSDAFPAEGERPTSTWTAGDTILDTHHITLPADLPPGQYELTVGMYRLDTLERLKVAGEELDYVRLASPFSQPGP